MFKWKDILLILFIITLTASLVFIGKRTDGIAIFYNLSPAINKQILYQLITLVFAIVFLCILFLTKKSVLLQYLRKGNISANIIPEPLLGINPKANENWFHLGRNFAIIISIVTIIIIYFQSIRENETSIREILNVMPFSIAFAISNSFVEESITRLGVVVVLKDRLKDKTIPIVSALIFGTVHYWGNPGGFIGVFVAGFLGWILAKSILETKGIFWAWLIHCMQDVIIFSALLTI